MLTTLFSFLTLSAVEQDFSPMFGKGISARFVEKWPTVFKNKVL